MPSRTTMGYLDGIDQLRVIYFSFGEDQAITGHLSARRNLGGLWAISLDFNLVVINGAYRDYVFGHDWNDTPFRTRCQGLRGKKSRGAAYQFEFSTPSVALPLRAPHAKNACDILH